PPSHRVAKGRSDRSCRTRPTTPCQFPNRLVAPPVSARRAHTAVSSFSEGSRAVLPFEPPSVLEPPAIERLGFGPREATGECIEIWSSFFPFSTVIKSGDFFCAHDLNRQRRRRR